MHSSDPPSPGGNDGDAVPHLSDEAIYEIAQQIRREIRQSPLGDAADSILSRANELPPQDEARVEAALETLALLDSIPEAADGRSPPADGDDAPGKGPESSGSTP